MTTPESDRPLEPGTIIANNYRVAARLGAGGMGTVYLADNITLSQRVVVKVLRGGQAGAGHEEAQMLANLQHPNVVTVYAHDPALDCIVMEFLDGASPSTLLEKGIDRVNAIRVALAAAGRRWAAAVGRRWAVAAVRLPAVAARSTEDLLRSALQGSTASTRWNVSPPASAGSACRRTC